TAVYSIVVPRPSIHERFDEEPKRVPFVQLKLTQQLPQWFGIAAAGHQILQAVAHLVAEESLNGFKINEITDGPHLAADLEKIADGRAIGIAARQWREIFESQLTVGLADSRENDVGHVESGG